MIGACVETWPDIEAPGVGPFCTVDWKAFSSAPAKYIQYSVECTAMSVREGYYINIFTKFKRRSPAQRAMLPRGARNVELPSYFGTYHQCIKDRSKEWAALVQCTAHHGGDRGTGREMNILLTRYDGDGSQSAPMRGSTSCDPSDNAYYVQYIGFTLSLLAKSLDQ